MTSSDGFQWTPSRGPQHGLPSLGVIAPQRHKIPASNEMLDAIVIGAGYAGLVAARDLATQGKRVMLIEARDRIGGRTWHTTIDGFNYEMGGTWVHWQMPHIYREMSLYGLQGDWIVTQTEGGPLDYLTLNVDGVKKKFSHQEEAEFFTKAWGTFCNVDGHNMREAMPFPFDSMQKADQMHRFDKVSCQERFDEIQDQLSKNESTFLHAVLLQMGGGPLKDMGLLDALRWWSLGGWTGTGLNDIALRTRLKSGQSNLARKIFDHAVSTDRLSYAFKAPVSRIEDHGLHTVVTTRTGEQWTARHVICTIPLNVLADISFQPPLPAQVYDAVAIGQTNRCNKLHFDVAGPDLVSWSSFGYPGKGIICALADKLTPANDTHLVAFGPSAKTGLGLTLGGDPVDNIKAALEDLLPVRREIKRIVYHDWVHDEFAKGTWCYLPPTWTSKYLGVMQQPHGNIVLASADWSDGWRGWIDGAVQQGMQAAQHVIGSQELKTRSKI